jgi:hypothetical protein
MKLNNSDLSRITKLGLIAMCLVSAVSLTSCGDGQNQENTEQETSNTEEAQTKALSSEVIEYLVPPAPPTFSKTGKLKIYNRLLGNSDCSNKSNSRAFTRPIDCTTFSEGLKRFEPQYTSVKGGLKLNPSIVKLNIKLKQVIQQAVTGGHYGLVFHYGYDEAGDSLVYILSRGEIYGEDTMISYCPFVDSISNNDFYLLMATKNGSGYNEIDASLFKSYTDAYFDKIKRDGKALTPGNKDPQMVYHRARGFADFLSAFNSQNPTYLYIGHGSFPHTSATENRHVPFFALGDNQVFFMINNYPASGTNEFENKGLDVGRQCPPNCPSTVRICN